MDPRRQRAQDSAIQRNTLHSNPPERGGRRLNLARETKVFRKGMASAMPLKPGNKPALAAEVLLWLTKTARLLRAMLREIFDEAAYDRFLVRHQLAASRSTYAAFLAESR